MAAVTLVFNDAGDWMGVYKQEQAAPHPAHQRPEDRLMNFYLLQRRGSDLADGEDRAMIVRAASEAHARVAAADRGPDLSWASDSYTVCAEIAAGGGVLHTIYAPKLGR